MEKELIISRIGIFEYFECNNGLKSALSDYYVKNSDCGILLARDNAGKQVGLLIYEWKAVIEILYVKTNDSSVKKELLNYLIGLSDKVVRYRIIDNEDDEKTALECGFRYENNLNIYRSKDKDHPGAVSFLEKYNKIYDSLLKKNCKVKSIAELSENELNQIKYNTDGEFASELNPGKFLDGNLNDLSRRVSTAVVKDDKVVAYSLIRCVGNNKCIFEILCVAGSYQKTFAIVPVIIRPLNELKKEGFTYITFTAYQKNAKILKVYEKHMSEAIELVAVQHNMVYTKVE